MRSFQTVAQGRNAAGAPDGVGRSARDRNAFHALVLGGAFSTIFRNGRNFCKVAKGVFLLTVPVHHAIVSAILRNGCAFKEKKSNRLIELEIGSQLKCA